ncbi:MAG: ABC transporter ATP-binding protein [Armatimonadota bacterium]|nr:ABC transporter ATP-binding protein [Armatimonadota bacterium]
MLRFATRWPGGVHDLAGRLRGRRPEPRGTLALDRVSFEVREGEAFAIIGPNGAGKTTALKLVSRISYPTGGRVRVRGRVAALIEVGSGVHPELTARENIWLYGQILGMSRADIRWRLDEIVEFAEIGHVLDTPVKMYSSGMQLRLGFAIASHLEPDIFVVDEALAVGDAGFQAKCVERMRVLVREGRTLLFVSHSLGAVREVCRRALFLVGEREVATGPVDAVVAEYLRFARGTVAITGSQNDVVRVVGFWARTAEWAPTIGTGDPVVLELELDATRDVEGYVPGIGIADSRPGNLILATVGRARKPVPLKRGLNLLRCEFSSLPLLPGLYQVWFGAADRDTSQLSTSPCVVGPLLVSHAPDKAVDVLEHSGDGSYGPIYVPFEFTCHHGTHIPNASAKTGS